MKLNTRLQRKLVLGLTRLPRPVLRRIAGPLRRSPEGVELDVQTALVLRLMEKSGVPPLHELGVARARRAMDKSSALLDEEPLSGVAVEEARAPSAEGGVPVRIYRDTAARAFRPIVVYYHGGGFVVGSFASHDRFCRALALRAGVHVAAVDYRLAPEHRFPAAVDDSIAAFRWVAANAAALGGQPRAIAVAGDSAGGTMAAVVAQQARRDDVTPAFQLLIYPKLDMMRAYASHQHFGDGLLLTRSSMHWFGNNYMPGDAHASDPRASPMLAENLQDLPPAAVITAGFDPLRDEGEAYAERLRAAGVRVHYRCYENMIHNFLLMRGAVDEARRALDELSGVLRRALGADERPGAALRREV